MNNENIVTGIQKLAENALESARSLIRGKCQLEATVALNQYQEFSMQAGTYDEAEFFRLGNDILALK